MEEVLLIKPYVFEDFRGEYVSLYNEELYKSNDIITLDFASYLRQLTAKLLTDTEFAKTISQNARLLVEKNHSWESVFNSLDRIIEDVMKSK